MGTGIINSRSSFGSNSYEYAFSGTAFKQKTLSESDYSEKAKEKSTRISNMKKLVKEAQNGHTKKQTSSILESTKSYGNSVRATRTKANDTSTQLKKLKYKFKDISSQIRKSKTSVNAKQVASKARREVVQLKLKLQTGKYDKEELEAAIEHAKSMERAAKKKARHLEEEELIKITDSGTVDNSAANIEERFEIDIEEAVDEKKEELEEQLSEEMQEEMAEEMAELLDDAMEEMMEETLGDIAESIMSVTDYEMNEEEFKTFKLKHRASEDKTMLEADAKYLKAIFDMYSRRMGNGDSISMSGISNSVFIGGDSDYNTPNIVDISV